MHGKPLPSLIPVKAPDFPAINVILENWCWGGAMLMMQKGAPRFQVRLQSPGLPHPGVSAHS